jgi:hypothetical protein
VSNVVFDTDYVPHFSGHETFPLRQLWLKKAYDAVLKEQRGAFSNEDAIVTFGVGKNMVSSIKHWALACGVIESKNGGHSPTELGDVFFSANGLDPYCERFGTSWLFHWNLCGASKNGPRATTWYIAFNLLGEISFNATILQSAIDEYLTKKTPKISVSDNTLLRDIDVFFRTYIPKKSTSMEDITEPMLAELGLIQISSNGLYEFRRGPKSTLPDSVFLYSLIDFWHKCKPSQSTISFESIAYDPGSPGRVFKLDENSIAERLINLEKYTNGSYLWTDTAGQKNVHCIKKIELLEALGVNSRE